MNILQIISSEGLYGAEKWILAFLKAAKKYSLKVSLINLTNQKDYKSEIITAAKSLNINALNFYSSGRFNPIAGLRLGKWVRENNIDLIHSHGFKADTLGLIAAAYSGCKIISTPHGWSIDKDIKLILYEKFDRFIFRFMDCVCPLSPKLYSELNKKSNLKSKLKYIINGIDIDEVDSVKKNPQNNCDQLIVGYIGRLIESKNIPILINSVASLIDDQKKIKLEIVGDGPLRNSLQKQVEALKIESHVKFYGFRKDVIQILKSFDVLVLPSLSEGIPRCVMEAMAANTLVVASDIPGCRELITHKKTGLIFVPNNKNELSKHISSIMDQNVSAESMVKEARIKIEENFSNYKMVKSYINVYDDLLTK